AGLREGRGPFGRTDVGLRGCPNGRRRPRRSLASRTPNQRYDRRGDGPRRATDPRDGGLGGTDPLPHLWRAGVGRRTSRAGGTRSFQELVGDDLSVVAVHASPRTRYERMLRRRRTDDAGSIEAFRARDLRELSWGLGDVIATADVMLVNEGTLEEFRRQARTALGRLHG